MKKGYAYICFLLAGTLLWNTGTAQHHFKGKWIDSVYQALSEPERIGQLFMVAAYSGGKNLNQAQIDQLISRNQVGGLIFMQGTPEEQARLTNRYQKNAKVPLLIGMDAEWGLGMRLTGVNNFPRQMMIGATRDTGLMYAMGVAVADQCKRMGVHINFAPDIDVNNNPNNPVINFRSFGDQKEWVSRLGIAYMRGMQDNDVMACAKHFPGHGDVSVDSHLDLPVINKSAAELHELELYPFRQLIDAGIKSVMIAHLSVPALDNTPNLPSTLSEKIVTGLLKKEMGFDGLIFTDAMNMSGVTKYFPNGESDLKAFLAGNDVLLFSQNVPLAIQKIQWALRTNKISQEELARRVKKILAAKYEAGLSAYRPVKVEHATQDLNQSIHSIREQITRKAVTLVKDKGNLVGRMKSGKVKVAYVNINGGATTDLQKLLANQFPDLNRNTVQQKPTPAQNKALLSAIEGRDVVVVGIHNLGLYPGAGGRYGLSAEQVTLLQQLATKSNVVFVLMGNPYVLKFICSARSVLVTYEDDAIAEQAAYDVLMGKLPAPGILPVAICK